MRGAGGDNPAVGKVPALHLAVERCRFQTWRPVQRGLDRINATVGTAHAVPARCGLRAGAAADGRETPASFSARAIWAMLCPARRWVNTHRTTYSVSGSGSSRRAASQAAWTLFGCGRASGDGTGRAAGLGPVAADLRQRRGTRRGEDAYRNAGVIAAGTPVPGDADAQTVLLARFGRGS